MSRASDRLDDDTVPRGKRPRSAVVVLDAGRILLMYRRKGRDIYFTVPGGKQDPGETAEEAAVREIAEETGLRVRLARKLWSLTSQDRLEHFYLASEAEGEPVLGGPEMAKVSPTNRYGLAWIPLHELDRTPLRPEEAKRRLLREFAGAVPSHRT